MTDALRCELFPEDLDAAVAFYAGVLGFRVVRDERGAAQPYVALERGRARLGLASSAVRLGGPASGVELVLEVDDVDAERARVRAAGWPVDEEFAVQPWGLRDFRLLDPDGRYWRVTSTDGAPGGEDVRPAA